MSRLPTIVPVLAVFVACQSIAAHRASAEQANASRSPNILFILVDDMGFSDLGCYGGEIETPHLDGLAKNGLRFTQFYNTGRCWPTRAALLTGYYPHMIRRDALPGTGGGGKSTRPAWAKLLPAYLKDAGYRSYHSGKWHIDGPALPAGFDHSFMRSNRGFFYVAGGKLDDKPFKPSPAIAPAMTKDQYATIGTTEHALGVLKDHAKRHGDKPFFHYLAYIAPHFPLQALPEDIAKYRDRYLVGWDKMRQQRFAKQKKLDIHNTTLSKLEVNVGPPYHFPKDLDKLGDGEVFRPHPWDALNDKQRRFQATKMAIHAAMVDRVDQEIGRVIAQLKAMGQFENTLIMFASDNGASAEIMVRHDGHDPSKPAGSHGTYLCLGPGFSSACNTPFRRHKTWVHEGGIATPLVVHWPRGIKARGELRRTPGHVIDIVPTVLDLAGITPPTKRNGEAIPPMHGKSLVPAMAKDVTVQRDMLWWMHDGHRAVRVGDWKLVAAKGDPWALYDLSTDRAESNNLVKKHPQRAKQLEAAFNKQMQAMVEVVKRSGKGQGAAQGKRKK